MRRKISTAAAAIVLTCALWGCQSITGRTAGQNLDDTNITAAVKAQLGQDRLSTLTRIDVDTNDGVVALNGTVESAEQRSRAEQLARKVGGVKRVVNNLQVQR
jgi:hyperosmotically inducible protein